MLAVLSASLPANPSRYSFEFKWDGVRALAFWDGKQLRLQGRNENDITPRYPELHRLGEAIGKRSCVLDGEIVALDEVDRPSFALLQQRMHLSDPLSIQRVMKSVPVLYVIFDLLFLNGRSMMDRPLEERRAALEELTIAGASWQVSPAHVGEGASMLATAEENKLEGLVAKELGSTYAPGRRSPAWLKIKTVMRQEFVVGGYTSGNNGRDLGAMLVGYYEGKQLRFAGKVGSGFTRASLAEMHERLLALECSTSPFSDAAAGTKRTRFSKPSGPIHYVQPTSGRRGGISTVAQRTDRFSRRLLKACAPINARRKL